MVWIMIDSPTEIFTEIEIRKIWNNSSLWILFRYVGIPNPNPHDDVEAHVGDGKDLSYKSTDKCGKMFYWKKVFGSNLIRHFRCLKVFGLFESE